MAHDSKTVLLGAEWDDDLRTRLRDALKDMGARMEDHVWSIGGSQEMEMLEVTLQNQRVHVEAETYVGLTLTGPPDLVDRVCDRLASGKG